MATLLLCSRWLAVACNRHFSDRGRSMRRFIVTCALAFGCAAAGFVTACTADDTSAGERPVDVTVDANDATREASLIRTFHARTEAGVVLLDALDEHHAIVASFRVTKIPGVRYTDETVPSMVVAIEAS